jgi:DNA replication protein DnaC
MTPTTMPARPEPTMRKQGESYMLDTSCRQCGKALALDCGENRPAPLVKSLARSVLCESCSETDAERDERRAREEAFAARLAASGLAGQRIERGFADFDERSPDGRDRRRAITAARDWARMADPGGLCLLGGVGCGKSALALAAASERVQHAPVRWVSLALLVADLSNFEDREARRNAVKVLTGKRALCLDDFDKVSVSEWLASQLFAAIDGRIARGAPLLITTNLGADELRAKFGDAIYSRIEGYCRMVELPGPDYRLVNRRAAA